MTLAAKSKPTTRWQSPDERHEKPAWVILSSEFVDGAARLGSRSLDDPHSHRDAVNEADDALGIYLPRERNSRVIYDLMRVVNNRTYNGGSSEGLKVGTDTLNQQQQRLTRRREDSVSQYHDEA